MIEFPSLVWELIKEFLIDAPRHYWIELMNDRYNICGNVQMWSRYVRLHDLIHSCSPVNKFKYIDRFGVRVEGYYIHNWGYWERYVRQGEIYYGDLFHVYDENL